MSSAISKILAVFFTVMSIFLPAQPENVEITIRQVTTESSSLSFELTNNTGRMIGRPLVALIEKQDENGNWQEADVGFGYNEIAYNVYPGQSTSEGVSLAALHGNDSYILEKGLYRITVEYPVKSVLKEVLKQKMEKVRVTEEFTVIEAE